MSQLDDPTKQALRLAAMGALLHNLGKINTRFLDKQVNNTNNDYLYQHILGLIASHVSQLPAVWQGYYDTNTLSNSAVLDSATVTALKATVSLPTPLNDRSDYTVGDLIEYLGQGEPWYRKEDGQYGIQHIYPGGSRLTHLMNRAHRGASGGEKENIATAQQPEATNLYLSTPFGYETPAPNINNINDLLQQIEATIQQHLESPVNPFPLADVIAVIRPLLSKAIADTQRPLNDVTVGDIGHTGMAFLLTQAGEWIFTKRCIDHDELAKKQGDNSLLWRVLTIHTDSRRFLEEASSAADLRVRQQQLKESFQKISRQLEETLLAVEIYADEQRLLFIFPNLDQTASAYQSIENIVTAFSIDGLRLRNHLSGPVTNHPDDNNETYIGDQVRAQLAKAPPYDLNAATIADFWPNQAPSKQLCTACNLRPQGYGAEHIEVDKRNSSYNSKKAEERNICCICMKRRTGVAEKWAKDNLNKTVWLDEVADSNGRLALIVGQWNIKNFIQSHFYPHADRSQSKAIWLHTVEFLNNPPLDQHIFTINGQAYAWEASQSHLSGEQELARLKQTNLTIHAPSSMAITVQDVAVAGHQLSLIVQEDLASTFTVNSQVRCLGQDFRITGIHLLETVNDAGRQRILNVVLWDATHPFIVKKATKVNVLEITSPGEGAKNESFARLRRIWQTTQTFWQTALDETDANGNPIVPPVDHRLEIIPQHRDKLDLGHYHVYDLKLTPGVKLSVVWDSDIKRFISCDNLEYLAKPELLDKPVIEFLKGELTLEESSGYGSQNKTWGTITVEHAGKIKNSAYAPVIPILAEPRTFMALVPADKALDVVGAIRSKYEREMGKVRNRLPLHLGIVYFYRRTPLRAALDAGRRMLQYEGQGAKDEIWTVQNVETGPLPDNLPDKKNHLARGTQQFAQTITVELEQNGRCLTWYVPAKMGDGQTDDNWYPYVFIKSDVGNRTHIFKALRPKSDGTSEECWLVHASELKEGDHIFFTPATLDFQWLDSAATRFEIGYNKNGRRHNHLLRPYLLDQLDELEAAWKIVAGDNGLTSSQIYALRDIIEAKRESWQPTTEQGQKDGMFRQFCRDAVVNANWKGKPDKEKERLAGWAVSGLLTDAIQLYMGMMKQKPKREKKENE